MRPVVRERIWSRLSSSSPSAKSCATCCGMRFGLCMCVRGGRVRVRVRCFVQWCVCECVCVSVRVKHLINVLTLLVAHALHCSVCQRVMPNLVAGRRFEILVHMCSACVCATQFSKVRARLRRCVESSPKCSHAQRAQRASMAISPVCAPSRNFDRSSANATIAGLRVLAARKSATQNAPVTTHDARDNQRCVQVCTACYFAC